MFKPQSVTADFSAGNVAFTAAQLAGVSTILLANAPGITSNDKQRKLTFAPMRRSLTVSSGPSMGAEILLICGATLLRVGQYKTAILSFDGTPDGMMFVASRDDVSALADLADVDLTGISDGNALVYDQASGSFKAGAAGGGAAGRPLPILTTLTNSNGVNVPHSFSFDPDVWARNAVGEPCDVDYTYGAGVVNVVFHQPFTGKLYVG